MFLDNGALGDDVERCVHGRTGLLRPETTTTKTGYIVVSTGSSMYLDNGSLGDDAERCVHWGAGVLLDPNQGQVEGRFQLWVSHVRLSEPQTLHTATP